MYKSKPLMCEGWCPCAHFVEEARLDIGEVQDMVHHFQGQRWVERKLYMHSIFYYKGQGIQWEFIAPYTPVKNVFVYQMHRKIQDQIV